MRSIARYAGISTATLYRYFPSKHVVLVATLCRWLERFEATATPLGGGASPGRRLHWSVTALHTAMYANPALAQTLSRAYAVTDPAAADGVECVRSQTGEMFADALGNGRPTADEVAVGEILADVWAANVVAVGHGRRTVAELLHRLTVTVDLLLGQTASSPAVTPTALCHGRSQRSLTATSDSGLRLTVR
jgi:TetR/AcrR family transcriptional regulator, cholesterol catabolism regulator